jgi:hypothetical protein
MYFGQPVVSASNLRDSGVSALGLRRPPRSRFKGDGEAPVAQELKYLGSMLLVSKNFDDSVTIMARIRLARIAFTKLQKATSIFGTRRVAAALESESKQTASKLRVAPSRARDRCFCMARNEHWVVSAGNMRLLRRFHRKCINSDPVQGTSLAIPVTLVRKHHLSTEELEVEAKLGTGTPVPVARHQASCSQWHSRVLRYLGHVFCMDADRTPSLLQRCHGCPAGGWCQWMASSLQL